MADTFARNTFPKQYSKLEKNRQAAVSRPLNSDEVTSLLSMRFGGEPILNSIEDLYSEEYKAALKNSASLPDLEKIQRYRAATPKEANLLYCDLHARERKSDFSSGGAPSE